MYEKSHEFERSVLCSRGMAAMVARGEANYIREDIVPRLLPIERGELLNPSLEYTKKLCLRLARALRCERAKGRSGHWGYDINRHLALVQAYRAERARLVAERIAGMRGQRPVGGCGARGDASPNIPVERYPNSPGTGVDRPDRPVALPSGTCSAQRPG